ncbi:MAG TPA: hypothetical protein VK835_13840 [Bacteroidia bacterium]|jgi:hypothetical protein|nr:hypothetical protein [Bacteroidia bacterium]
MNFQEFKIDFENKLKDKVPFELLEFHYLPYIMGAGILVYRINGYTYKLTYEGRDAILMCEQSKLHEKYDKCTWGKLFQQSGLVLQPTNSNLIF